MEIIFLFLHILDPTISSKDFHKDFLRQQYNLDWKPRRGVKTTDGGVAPGKRINPITKP